MKLYSLILATKKGTGLRRVALEPPSSGQQSKKSRIKIQDTSRYYN
jgi:small subunit ribosomal protein S8e